LIDTPVRERDGMASGLDHIPMDDTGAGGPVPAAPAVLASAATGIVSFIERYGGDIDGIFGNAGIAPDMAGCPTLRLRLASFCGLFEEAARRTRNDNFGLWFGNQFQPRDLGLWGYAAIAAPTVGGALATLVDLFGYHQESSVMRLARDTGGLARLTYQITAPEIVERRQDAELSLGMFLNVLREGLGPTWAPEEVHFVHPRPVAWREHEAAFAAPVLFGQPANALLFPPEVLDRPMPARDARLMSVMSTCLVALATHRPESAGLFDRVREAIRERLPVGWPALDQVSGALRVPATAIRRELGAHGVTYRDLIEATRRDLALSYLGQRQLPLTEIAFLLGYSELSAFTRAFTRWTGTCPRTWRRARTRH
jgi:AraC-like DNA-binding protein